MNERGAISLFYRMPCGPFCAFCRGVGSLLYRSRNLVRRVLSKTARSGLLLCWRELLTLTRLEETIYGLGTDYKISIPKNDALRMQQASERWGPGRNETLPGGSSE